MALGRKWPPRGSWGIGLLGLLASWGAFADEEVPADETPAAEEAPAFVSRGGEAGYVRLSLSSWAPGRLTSSSRLADTTPFGGSGAPTASFFYVTRPLVQEGRVSLLVQAGLSFALLRRTGMQASAATTPARAVGESLFLFPVRVGSEARVFLIGPVSIYGGLDLRPSLGFTKSTAFSDGQTIFGLPLGFAAGLSLDLGWFAPQLREVRLHAGVEATWSLAQARNLSGWGIEGGVSVPL